MIENKKPVKEYITLTVVNSLLKPEAQEKINKSYIPPPLEEQGETAEDYLKSLGIGGYKEDEEDNQQNNLIFHQVYQPTKEDYYEIDTPCRIKPKTILCYLRDVTDNKATIVHTESLKLYVRETVEEVDKIIQKFNKKQFKQHTKNGNVQ